MGWQTDLADALVADLNAGEFSQAFQAARRLRVRFDLPNLQALQVTVAPAARSREMLTRLDDAYQAQLDVAIQQKVDPDDDAQTGPLLALLDEIEDAVYRHFFDLPGGERWGCYAVRTVEGAEAGYAWEHLDRPRSFTGILRFTFRR